MSHKLTPHTKVKSNTSIKVCVVETSSSKWAQRKALSRLENHFHSLSQHRKNRFELREAGDVLLQQFRVSPVLCRSSEPSGPGSPQLICTCSSPSPPAPWLRPTFPPCPHILLCWNCSIRLPLPPLRMLKALQKKRNLWETFNLVNLLGGVGHALPTEVCAVPPGTPCTFPQSCCFIHTQLSSLPCHTCQNSSPAETSYHLVINNTSFSSCPSKNPTPSSALGIHCRTLSSSPQYSQPSEKPSVLPKSQHRIFLEKNHRWHQ